MYFCYLLVILNLSLSGTNAGNYNFHVELINEAIDRMHITSQSIDCPFCEESDENRAELCLAAKKYLDLDGLGPEDIQHFVEEFIIIYPNFTRKIYLALKCDTIPAVWLRPRELHEKKEIVIMNMKNNFLDGTRAFHFRVMEDDPVPFFAIDSPEEVAWYPKLLENHLSTLLPYERLHICSAAKAFTRRNARVKKMPILQDSDVSEAEIFDFPNGIGKQISIKCPSSPTMYIYLQDFDSDATMMVVLPEETHKTIQ